MIDSLSDPEVMLLINLQKSVTWEAKVIL